MTGDPGGARPGLTAVPGVAVGHAHDRRARTGCTAVLGPFRGAVETRGLATGSRELDALSPLHSVTRCDALLLTGGSAFGLSAADGVVRWLEERGRGFETSAARVPIVPAAVIYDLAVGDAGVRPGPEMGHEAADVADEGPVREGPVGAGCGATVGKLTGGDGGEPSGVGSWSDELGGTTVAALAVVNAFGDVLDGEGRIVAGARGEDGEPLDTARALREGAGPAGFGDGAAGENTTLGVVATDAPLSRRDLRIVARQAMNGLVRRVSPAGTLFDGDMVFALSTGGPAVDAGEGASAAPRGGGPGAGAGGTAGDGGSRGAGPGAELLRVAVRAQEALERAVERAVTRGDG
jgi:L-aminopeptidase/D-esterase-like protein